MRRLSSLVMACALGLVATAPARADRVAVGQDVVIAGHPEATRLGLEVLRKGGNAADALVTVSLALGVAEPGNSGPGGKLVMLYYEAKTGKVTSLAALGAAPRELDVEKARGLAVEDRKRGWRAACIPGLVAGLGAAHERWGSGKWEELVEPAARLADEGFVVSELAADMMAEFPKEANAEAQRIYIGHDTALPKAGEVLKNPDMAATLRAIARGGAKAFYEGEIAEKVVRAARASGSTFSLEDFRGYRPRFLEAVEGEFDGHRVYSSPPPLSGGMTLVMALKCLDGWDWGSAQPRDARYIDSVCRVVQQVYPIVTRSAADVPEAKELVAEALSEKSIRALREKARAADVPFPYGEREQARDERVLDDLDQASTTHLIIADRQGNVACVTQSLGYHFGSGVVAEGTGFLLNNDMNNFAYLSGVNLVAPGKWPRSTMAPTIVTKDGRPVLAIGSPAGQRIPVMIAQVIVDVMKFGRDVAEAVPAPRFHLRRTTGGRPNEVDLESGMPDGLKRELERMGWATYPKANAGDFYFGAVNAVRFLPDGQKVGVADQRRTNDAGGD